MKNPMSAVRLVVKRWGWVVLLFAGCAAQGAAPVFVSTPPSTAVADVPYWHVVVGSDTDGDRLTFRTVAIPGWLRMATNVAGGAISSVAGTGASFHSGDGGAATNASLSEPAGVCMDSSGNVYVAEMDWDCSRVRRISASDGSIRTVAGVGAAGYGGDGGPATNASLGRPRGLAVAPNGDLYIADYWNHRVRKVSAASGVIVTVAGTGVDGHGADGLAATNAALSWPVWVAVSTNGDLLIAVEGSHAIRRVSAGTGILTTVAGSPGHSGFSGDGGLAIHALLSSPSSVVECEDGSLVLADQGNLRVRRVARDGTISTIAGNGAIGYAGDGGPATNATMRLPICAVVGPGGDVLIADAHNNAVRRLSGADGVLTTVIGTGAEGYMGDGGPATNCWLKTPMGLAPDAHGGVYVADWRNFRVRYVAPEVVLAGTPREQDRGTNAATLVLTDGVLASTQHVEIVVRVRTAYEKWQSRYFTEAELGMDAVSGAAADADGDSVSNGAEFLADTSPRNADDYLHFVGMSGATPQLFAEVGALSTGRVYNLEVTTNVVTPEWVVLWSNRGSGQAASLIVSNAMPVSYYRLRAVLP